MLTETLGIEKINADLAHAESQLAHALAIYKVARDAKAKCLGKQLIRKERGNVLRLKQMKRNYILRYFGVGAM